MTLKRMVLRDFVIVQELELELSSGFTVLTGETGAGKSILIDALQIALGARTDPGVVREGASKADITAEFSCPAHIRAWLEEAGFTTDDTLLLRRVVDTLGKSRAWINGTPATATQLRTLGDGLVDIHGQHAWHTLTRSGSIRILLDAYAGISTKEIETSWAQWRLDYQVLQHAYAAQDTLRNERERLQWQIDEVDKLAPGDNEWIELDTQHKRLSHAQTLHDAAQAALSYMQEEEFGAQAKLARAHSLLHDHGHIEPEFNVLADTLTSGMAVVDDVAHSLQNYLHRNDTDTDTTSHLNSIDLRLSQWLALARRYKCTAEELPTLLHTWKRELHQLDASADLEQLKKVEATSAKAYHLHATNLSTRRLQVAPQLSAAITQAMQALGMAGGCFEVVLTPAEPSLHGMDDVAFLVAGHPGTTPKPIGKIASGGELSRIALAISVTTSQLGMAPTLIFDEVDSGIGGAVAETVGRLLQKLGHDRQVLAVTHLAQVAACAEHHLVVSKNRNDTSTLSAVTEVHNEKRTSEIARMLSGVRSTEATLAHAREMLNLNSSQQKSGQHHGT